MPKENKLLTLDSINAYKERFLDMSKVKFSKEGDEKYIEKITATSEQVENLYVKAKVNGFEIHNDEPKNLGGSNNHPRPIDTFIASIANCLELAALLYFSTSNLMVDSIKVIVEAFIDKRSILNHEKAPPVGFYNFNYTFLIKSNEEPKLINRVLEKVAKYCPIKGTLSRVNKFEHSTEII